MKYKKFSERKGFKKGIPPIQINSMNGDLRKSFWNPIVIIYIYDPASLHFVFSLLLYHLNDCCDNKKEVSR